eukprot:g873.t1
MILLNWFMIRALKQRYIPMTSGHGCMGRCCQKYGPVLLTAIATPLIMAEPTRHVLGDTGLWPWCGDPSQQNGMFPRVNESWTDDCFWSSTEYRCDIPCCVPGNNSLATTNDLNMNYLLEVDSKSGASFQRSFSENCGLAADRKTRMPIDGATFTNPNCTCAGAPCDMLKNPFEQMGQIKVVDASDMVVLQSIAQTAGSHKQQPTLPMGFMSVDSETATEANVYFGPFWPEHPQIDDETLAWIKDQTVKTGGGDASTPDCNCNNCMSEGNETMSHLSFIGWLFTIFFTYTGFVCLAVGTLWNADIIKKLKDMKKKWQLLRGRRRRKTNRKNAEAALLQNAGSKAGGDFI